MKNVQRIVSLLLSLMIGGGNFAIISEKKGLWDFVHGGMVENTYEAPYTMSKDLSKKLTSVYNNFDFSTAWGIYDVSKKTLKEVASKDTDKPFQSNCTIKAAMLLYICTLMDKGKMSKKTKLSVNKKNLHYTDFNNSSGKYSVEYLLTQMIRVSNNVCYEVFLRHVTKEAFNSFLKSIGSGTQIASYNFMGNTAPKNRAIEWFNIYQYCHSSAQNAKFAWDLLVGAKYSPIRDGLGVTVAHKSGWYYKKGTCGTAADCAIVQSKNGGAYLMIIFTKKNSAGNYSEKYISKIADVLDDVWNEYYSQLKHPKEALF